MNNFTFYNNYFEIVRYLKNEDRLSMYDAIFNYMFEDKEPNFEGIKKGIWVNIKMPLDNSKTNYNNGKKGGRPKSESKTEEKPKQNPKETETKAKTKANNISIFLFLISNNNYKYINSNVNLLNKIKEWLEYKEQRKELYKEMGLKSLLTEIENNISVYGFENVINLINECMASNYKGIIFEKLKGKSKSQIPEWFNKEQKDEELTEEESKELKELLDIK